MKRKRWRYRMKYKGEADIVADNREDALERMNMILDRISDVYEVYDNENEVYEIENEELM